MLIDDPGFDERHISFLNNNINCFATTGRRVFSKSTLSSKQVPCCLCGKSLLSCIILLLFPSFVKRIKSLLRKNSITHDLNLKESTIDIDEYTPSSLNDALLSRPLSVGHDPHNASSQQKAKLSLHNKRFICDFDYAIRGPLFINVSLYHILGGFSPDKYFLGYDDIDLCLRAKAHAYNVAYSPIYFSSPKNFGVSRRPRPFKNRLLMIYNLLIRALPLP